MRVCVGSFEAAHSCCALTAFKLLILITAAASPRRTSSASAAVSCFSMSDSSFCDGTLASGGGGALGGVHDEDGDCDGDDIEPMVMRGPALQWSDGDMLLMAINEAERAVACRTRGQATCHRLLPRRLFLLLRLLHCLRTAFRSGYTTLSVLNWTSYMRSPNIMVSPARRRSPIKDTWQVAGRGERRAGGSASVGGVDLHKGVHLLFGEMLAVRRGIARARLACNDEQRAQVLHAYMERL